MTVHLLRTLRTQERQLAAELIGKGWTAHQLRNGHLRMHHPDGEHAVVMPRTPSDHRGWKNLRAEIRRIERAVGDN